MKKQKTVIKDSKFSFGERFLTDHADAELEFYWAVDVKIDIPKNKVLTGLIQRLQDTISVRLFVGLFKDGIFTFNTSTDFEALCIRSLDDVIIRDNYGTTYTGRQFLEIISLCETNG